MPFGKGGQDPKEAAQRSAAVRARTKRNRMPPDESDNPTLTRQDRIRMLDEIALTAVTSRDRINALIAALRYTEMGDDGDTAVQRSSKIDEAIGLEHGRRRDTDD